MWTESSRERMDGLQLRLATAAAWLGQIAERLGRAPRVLDYGAGTGMLLTLPLARRCPAFPITAFDPSPRNIGVLRQAAAGPAFANTRASSDRGVIGGHAPYDAVICADVLEHLPDPETVLRDIHSLLSPRGWLIVSVPNGFGCFEIGTFICDLLWISGLAAGARRWLRRGKLPAPSPDDGAAPADTLEIDPHLQFYTAGALESLLNRSGFEIAARRNRMFLGGFPFYYLERWPRLVRWNLRVGEKLPPAWCSGWLLLCARSESSDPAPAPRPSRTLRAWTAMKRWSNQNRWRRERPANCDALSDLSHSRL